jgi:large subunit ribosomal protein L30e
MSDLNNDLRLAIDTGKVSFGYRSLVRSINANTAKAVVLATKGKKEIVDDVTHVCGIADIRIIKFNGNGLELGAACGKPHSVNGLAILEPGNSNILNEKYE